MIEIPPLFLERMQRLLGDEYAAFLATYKRPPTNGLRANTLKILPQALQERLPLQLEAIAGIPSGFRIPEEPTENVPDGNFLPGKHPYHAAGLYYLQEPSAMSVAELLAPQPGETVLDLCAAPGGKSTHLAALMENQGQLVVNEIHPRRVWELAENLERWGVRNAAITNTSPQRLAEQLGPIFDRVLVDAPCSGEGMFRKSEIARQEWSPDLVQRCALRQETIVDQAVKLVKPGGTLAYSTCTFNPDENEAVIAHLLDIYPQFELVESRAVPASAAGRPEWLPAGKGMPELERAIRLWPQFGQGEGHFLALLRHKLETPPAGQMTNAQQRNRSARRSGKKSPALSRYVIQAWSEFTNSTLKGNVLTQFQNATNLRLVGSYLYLLPDGLPELADLKVIHPGWWLGSLKIGQSEKKARFEPSQALAMGLASNDCQQALLLKPDDPRLLDYLCGETLDLRGVTENFSAGWVLVTVDGFPLGWGKYAQREQLSRSPLQSRSLLKNYYPRGLRWA